MDRFQPVSPMLIFNPVLHSPSHAGVGGYFSNSGPLTMAVPQYPILSNVAPLQLNYNGIINSKSFGFAVSPPLSPLAVSQSNTGKVVQVIPTTMPTKSYPHMEKSIVVQSNMVKLGHKRKQENVLEKQECQQPYFVHGTVQQSRKRMKLERSNSIQSDQSFVSTSTTPGVEEYDKLAQMRREHRMSDWTPQLDKLLFDAVQQYDASHPEKKGQRKKRDWIKISKHVPNRNNLQCSNRWKSIKPGLKKGKWSKEEDSCLETILKSMVESCHPSSKLFDWKKVSEKVSGRNVKQCKERWFGHLSPEVKRDKPWTQEEDDRLLELARNKSFKWSIIKNAFPGRTADRLKNRWNSLIKKRKKIEGDRS